MPEQTWTFPQHADLPDDPRWRDEPDKVQWVDGATCLDLLIVRNHHGALCGYVGVPPGHPWHGRQYDELDDRVEVHGGLTYSDACRELICHVPGRPTDLWWLGFDCAHAFDIVPGFLALLAGRLPRPVWYRRARVHQRTTLPQDTYKGVRYVRQECERLAEQAHAAAVSA